MKKIDELKNPPRDKFPTEEERIKSMEEALEILKQIGHILDRAEERRNNEG